MSATEAGNSADAGSSSQSTPNEVPAGFERWRQSLARFTGMGLSDEERAERAKYDEQVKLATDWDRCEKWKSELMTRSPMIIFMLKQLRLAGCEFPASAMQCHPCDETRVGGFSPEHGILMCQNRFMNKKHMEDTLAHEMIHAFDHCRFKVDWSNLRHHACSESTDV
ncbi:hypothetical protein A1Q1_03822 [Trichosporon asahii var. asahii CBS 2479]|uniref:Mitochondrial inner membrane protease ATP23 n=1 Tax=Trichosporon asahii var. asahii (strain ATCC 90039 / CBS 2479 / JCM 2466 / KCTC 7840 / NBRC 103889/ NCYC 2677 / UAMH 7654) TaxID=1186058 RepID=J5SST8_TRIAS|nr:hypothetical protein A1Q1_03822 [Trichosporon asahii var. asahii CBS 2479]EJT47351.1 hypothetical protein A1Q1_03822 [Trichosporon asahii var. asahii CBS 2479]